ncbi:hypothetical protein [Kineosporia babensis]|uniref:HTTM domain-containing protein n=1 Tax=Kineosporia babensis TaxID=499548 RepID=A0A9X1NK00_9ACTN|nr:hypothetical protein [Kineosporia babensis]MCD5316397.1 hypothetical protein [Kineosporia babensis]
MTNPSTTEASGEPAARTPSVIGSLRSWVFEPVPLARVAVLRVLVYLFVVYDMFLVIADPPKLATVSAQLYRPVRMREWLHLPVPFPEYVQTLRVVVIIACAVMVLSVFRRLPGWIPLTAGLVAAAGFTDWASIGMSYSKVDHDHFALVVALWVLPTVGLATTADRRTGLRSEAAGWALLAIQIGVVATYFLSAVAKVRFGGWDWVTGSTFAWAMTRRGTDLGRALLDPPWILIASQWLLFIVEVLSPLILWARGKLRYLMVAGFLLFHLSTQLAMSINFLPLVVCLMAFLPLEKLIRQKN